MGLQLTITHMEILSYSYPMSLSIMVFILSKASLTPIISVSIGWNFMITLIEINGFMLKWMMTWRCLSNLRELSLLFYRVLRNEESLKRTSILILLVITSGTQNSLILIRFTRYHNPEGSNVLNSEYNRIPCIFFNRRILLKGYMSIKIKHLMRPYCLKSIHHLSRSKSYVLHRPIFKVNIMNSSLLGRLFFSRKRYFYLMAESLSEI